MSRYNRRRAPRWVRTFATVLVVVICCGVLGGLSDGFTNFDVATWFNKEVNPDNLLQYKLYDLEDTKTDYGVDIKVKDDGRITLSGTASGDVTELIQVVELEPGETYTIGGCDADLGKYGIYVEVNGVKHYAGSEDDATGATFTVADGAANVSASVYVFVKEDTWVLTTLKPTLAQGEKEIDFYE